jgi:hypothetical protein
MSIFKRGDVYWYHFLFAGRHIQESTKTHSKTLAKAAEQKRRRELEEGFNSRMTGRNAFGRSPTLRRTTSKNTSFATGRRNSRSMPAVTSPD